MVGVHKTVLVPAANPAVDCSCPIFSNVIKWIKQLDKLEFGEVKLCILFYMEPASRCYT